MQDAKRKTYSRYGSGSLSKAISIGLVSLVLQACQTHQLTPDQWNARTNALTAFSNSAYQFQQAQRPTYGPRIPYNPPAQANPFTQQPTTVYVTPQQNPWGQGNLYDE